MSAIKTLLGEKIDSPLSAFNNFMIDISDEFNNIFYPNSKKISQLLIKNQILFEDNTITLFNFIKIIYANEKFVYQFCGLIDAHRCDLIKISLENKSKIFQIFQKYLFIYNDIRSNYDETISQKYVENIYNKIIKNKSVETEMFLIPFKNKINHLYDVKDKTLDKLYSKYSYVITFTHNKSIIEYNIIRVLSSDLDESKSIENTRFLEKDYIKTDTVHLRNLNQFLLKLFYYGEI